MIYSTDSRAFALHIQATVARFESAGSGGARRLAPGGRQPAPPQEPRAPRGGRAGGRAPGLVKARQTSGRGAAGTSCRRGRESRVVVRTSQREGRKAAEPLSSSVLFAVM